eukprot:TRINITY_DN13063_c0_g4_i1.p1 TRINITY_DN13063_c0_g4~~TRINITY_DN13063_c0_g4_i1.p1  ORF type:complete len:695 (-),score=151.68 TRINITY_DN13063_c0_g4_i1:59-2143(-)
MEVLLEHSWGLAPPEDTFVSVRVGQVQKQSRFSKSRAYQFPPLSHEPLGRFGRIEIFQRVGHATVDLDRDLVAQQVQVPCTFVEAGGSPNARSLNLSVAVKEVQQMTAAKEVTKSSRKKEAKQKMTKAHDYLQQHRLEEVLAEAMKEVISTRPQDPHSFLSKMILKHAATATAPPPFLPAISPAKEPAGNAAPAPPPIPGRSVRASDPFGNDYNRPMSRSRSDVKLAPLEGSYKSVPAGADLRTSKASPFRSSTVSLTPFAGYYKKYLSTSDLSRAHGRFAASKGQAPTPLKLSNFRDYYRRCMRTNVASSIYRRFPKATPPKPTPVKLSNFRDYYQRVMKTALPPKLYERFPAYRSALEKATPTPVKLSNFQDYYARTFKTAIAPSMYARFPTHQPAPVKLSKFRDYYKRTMKTAVQASIYARFPSHKPPPVKLSNFQDYYARTFHTGSMNSVYSKFGVKPPTPEPYHKKPSVGTWLSARFEEDDDWESSGPSQTFTHHASVGTWLAAKPATIEKPWYYGRPATAEFKDFVPKLQDMLCEKERELEQLRQQILLLQKCGASLPESQASSPSNVAGRGVKATFEAPSSAAQQQPLSPEQRQRRFKRLASVGTWLARPLPALEEQREAEKPFQKRASVGTWLAPCPPDPFEDASLLERPESRLLKMDAKDLLASCKDEIWKKDQEIALLRRQLGL